MTVMLRLSLLTKVVFAKRTQAGQSCANGTSLYSLPRTLFHPPPPLLLPNGISLHSRSATAFAHLSDGNLFRCEVLACKPRARCSGVRGAIVLREKFKEVKRIGFRKEKTGSQNSEERERKKGVQRVN